MHIHHSLLLQKIIDSIDQLPAVEVVLGEHVFLTVGDYNLAGKSWLISFQEFLFDLLSS